MQCREQLMLRWWASAIHECIGQVRNFLDAVFHAVLVLVVWLTLLILLMEWGRRMLRTFAPILTLALSMNRTLGAPTVRVKSSRIPGI
jgi:hypothetical protein